MQYQRSQLSSAKPFWRVVLVLVSCLILHGWVLTVFLSHNANIVRRADSRRPPVNVEILSAQLPPPTKVEPPAPAPPPKPVNKPIARPKPVPRPPKPTPPPSVSQESPSSAATPGVNSDDTTVSADSAPAAATPGAGQSEGGSSNPVNGLAAGNSSVPPPGQPAADAPPPEPVAAPPKSSKLHFGAKLPAPPPAGTWNFSVHMGDYDQTAAAAALKLVFENDGSNYMVRAEVAATGITAFFYSGVRKDLSRGRITDNGLEPGRYAEQRNKSAERVTVVDYANNEIRFAGGETDTVPDGVQDRLSGLFQLGLLARAQPELFAPGKVIEFAELNLRNVEKVRFRVDGPAELKTHLGVLRTLHLTRVSAPGAREPELEVWLDYDFLMMPVRIRLTDSSRRVIDQLIDKKE